MNHELNNNTNNKDMKSISLLSYFSVTFEWYDFFLYAVFSTVITKQFTSGLNDTWSFIFALVTFSIGFLFRPVGGLIFGYLGDKYGRKTSLLINILLMSVPTFMVSILPTYESVGIVSPIILFFLRILQGIALGGGWAGISVYVAENAPTNKRAQYIANLGGFTILGLIFAVAANYYLKDFFGEADFMEWAWRIPFLFSTVFLSLSVWIRLKLKESPTYENLKNENKLSEHLLKDSFLNKNNLKSMAKSFLLLPVLQVFYYTAFTYSLSFLIQVLKINDKLATEIFLYATLGAFPVFFIVGSFNNHKFKKIVYLICSFVFALCLYPIFSFIASSGNPNLMKFNEKQIVLEVNKESCASQFNPLNTSIFVKSCDVAKNILSKSSLNYSIKNTNINSAIITVDNKKFTINDITSKTLSENKQDLGKIQKDFVDFIKIDGYEPTANKQNISYYGVLFGIWAIMSFAAILLTLVNSICVEIFTAKTRTISYSFVYNLASIIGGLTPAISFALVNNLGNMFAGIYFVAGVTALVILLSIIFLKFKNDNSEFRDIDWEGLE